MGAQVKDLIVLVELFTYSFLVHFRNSAKCAVILTVSFVSSGVQKGVDNSRLKERGTLTFFLHSFFEFYQRAQQNLFLTCLTED